MMLESVLFTLRILSALLLLSMLGLLFVFLWRDFRGTAQLLSSSRRPFGRLTVVEVIDGAVMRTGESFPLLALTSLGRASSNTIRIEDTFASAEHAVITLRSGQWWLEDRASRNGTLLNDMPVSQPVIITSGDIVAIGRKHFRLELEG